MRRSGLHSASKPLKLHVLSVISSAYRCHMSEIFMLKIAYDPLILASSLNFAVRGSQWNSERVHFQQENDFKV